MVPGVSGNKHSRIDIPTAFWTATVGGADLLGIPAGLLEPGRVFDAVTLRIGEGSTVDVWDDFDDWDRTFEKLVRRSNPSNISNVWVQGKCVTNQDPT
ncbi:MAG: amidohydrolase family protein, partial [Acidimicrobiaceae bacterium]|nr:amidohydrolase family protein [Acidimicrobiaceae bacterium]